eukprot:GHVP01001936.1.p1 GENE.GHVP01001936.1~~GHVP01001936.1.p1  ORF type:complete len:168 (-),score=26.64 GHVP01001936.1:338-841(-)
MITNQLMGTKDPIPCRDSNCLNLESLTRAMALAVAVAVEVAVAVAVTSGRLLPPLVPNSEARRKRCDESDPSSRDSVLKDCDLHKEQNNQQYDTTLVNTSFSSCLKDCKEEECLTISTGSISSRIDSGYTKTNASGFKTSLHFICFLVKSDTQLWVLQTKPFLVENE